MPFVGCHNTVVGKISNNGETVLTTEHLLTWNWCYVAQADSRFSCRSASTSVLRLVVWHYVLVWILCFICFVFLNKVSYIPGWPRTCYVLKITLTFQFLCFHFQSDEIVSTLLPYSDYAMLGVKPGISYSLGKHSTHWTTFPPVL